MRIAIGTAHHAKGGAPATLGAETRFRRSSVVGAVSFVRCFPIPSGLGKRAILRCGSGEKSRRREGRDALRCDRRGGVSCGDGAGLPHVYSGGQRGLMSCSATRNCTDYSRVTAGGRVKAFDVSLDMERPGAVALGRSHERMSSNLAYASVSEFFSRPLNANTAAAAPIAAAGAIQVLVSEVVPAPVLGGSTTQVPSATQVPVLPGSPP